MSLMNARSGFRRAGAGRLLAGAALVLLTAGAPVHAAGEPDPAAPDSGAAAARPAEELTIADIMARVDAVEADLGPLAQRLRRRNLDAESAVKRIPDLVDEYHRETTRLSFSRLDEVPELELISLRQFLESLDRRVASSRATLQAEVDELMPSRQNLRDASTLFESLLREPREEPLPEALRARLSGMLTSLEFARSALASRLDVVVAQLDRLIDLQTRVAESADEVRTEYLDRQRAVLRRSSEPLWDVRPSGWPALQQLLSRNLAILSGGTREFWQVNAGRCIATIGLGVLMIGGGLAYRRTLRRSMRPGEAATNLLTRRPATVLALLWLLLGPALLLPELTPGLGILRGIVGLACLFYLFPDLVRAPAVAPLRVLFCVVALTLLYKVLLVGSGFGRVLLLLLAVLGIAVFRRLEARLRDVEGGLGEGGLEIAGRWIIRLAPPVIMLGLVADLFGISALADQLITGTLMLGTVLIAFATADVILRNLLAAAVHGPGRRWSRAIARYPDLVEQRTTLVLRIGLGVVFLTAVPRLFPMMTVVFEFFTNLVGTDIHVGDVSFSLLDILAFVVSVFLALYAAQFVRFILDEDVFVRMPVSRGAASASSRLIYYGMVVGGLMFAFAVAGIELSKLTIIVGALGVGIGFGLQNIVSNVVSGLVIAFEHPFREGDQIAIGPLSGRVEQIGLRASRVRTFEGAELIIPNGNLVSGEVINWTLSDRLRRMEIPVGVAYGSDPRRVEEVLLKVVAGRQDVVRRPEPKVHFRGFGESSLDFMLLVWTADADARLDTESAIRFDLHAAFSEVGIGIPFPQRDIHIRTGKL